MTLRHPTLLILLTGSLAFILTCSALVHAETITLVVWDYGDNPDWWQWVQGNFEARYPHIKLELHGRGNPDRLIAASAGGVAPDVFYSSIAWGRDLFDKGLLRDLSSYIAQSTQLDLNEWIPVTRVYSQKDGRPFGIPFKMSSAAIVYNKSHFREAGLDDAPTGLRTWDELLDAARKLTRSDGERITRSGFRPSNNLEAFSAWLYSNGGTFYTEDLRAANFDTPAGRQTLDLIKELFRSGHVFSPEAGDFVGATASMQYWGTWAERDLAASGLDAGMTNFPPGPLGEQRATATWSNMYTIPTGAKNPDAAWRYIEFVTSLEAQIAFSEIYDDPGVPRFAYFHSDSFRARVARNPYMEYVPYIYESGGAYPYLRYTEVNSEVGPLLQAATSANASIPVEEALTRMREIVDRHLRELN